MIEFGARYFVDGLKTREAEALVAIHGDAFPHPWSAEDFRALIAERTVFVLAGRREFFLGFRRLAGFVIVRQVGGEAEILTIAVDRGNRRRGIGRLLMDEVLRRLYRDHVSALFLEVDRDNGPAVALYKALGFRAVGERKGYYRREDGATGSALVMRLQLR